jgi:hypothetical protein
MNFAGSPIGGGCLGCPFGGLYLAPNGLVGCHSFVEGLSSSDATILRHILDAANDAAAVPSNTALEADVSRFGVEPLLVRGVSDAI